MVGLKKRSHTQKSHPKVVNPRDIAGERKKKNKNKNKKNPHLSTHPPTHPPVQHELLQLTQVAGDVLQRGVRDTGTPRDVQHAQAPQVLGQQLHAVVRHLATAGQPQHRQVGQGVDDVDQAVVGHLGLVRYECVTPRQQVRLPER